MGTQPLPYLPDRGTTLSWGILSLVLVKGSTVLRRFYLFPQHLPHTTLAAQLLRVNSPTTSCRCAPLARSRISISARPGQALGWDSGLFCRQKSQAMVPGTVVCVLACELFGQSSGLSTLLAVSLHLGRGKMRYRTITWVT